MSFKCIFITLGRQNLFRLISDLCPKAVSNERKCAFRGARTEKGTTLFISHGICTNFTLIDQLLFSKFKVTERAKFPGSL